jgi:putative FmdB family regulatory protein
VPILPKIESRTDPSITKGISVPLYEYVCTKCHHRFEKIQKFSDPKIRKCPECGGKVEQAIHAPAVHFKGSGWYVTDYAGKGHAKEGASAEKPADKAEKKDESKAGKESAETKPKKTESKKSKD